MRVELNYGRGRLPVELADDLDVTIVRKPAMPLLADPQAAVRAALALPVDSSAAGGAGARRQVRVHPDLRHHPAGAQRPVPADHGPPAARCRHGGGCDHGAGGDRPTPAQRGRRARGAGGQLLGDGDGAGREPFRARRRGPCRPRQDADPRHAGQARPAAGGGRPQDRNRPGRAPFHGRLLGRPQGDRPRRRPQGHHHHLPQRALHEPPQGRELHPGGQSAARGAAGDREDAGRCFGAQHRDRRGPPALVRQFRRDRRQPHGSRAPCAGLCPGAGRRALCDRAHQRRRLPPRQDLLPDRQGHGGADGHRGAGRRSDHRLGMRRRHGLGRVRGLPAAPGRRRRRPLHGRDRGQALCRHRRVADPDAAQAHGGGPDPSLCRRAPGCGSPADRSAGGRIRWRTRSMPASRAAV